MIRLSDEEIADLRRRRVQALARKLGRRLIDLSAIGHSIRSLNPVPTVPFVAAIADVDNPAFRMEPPR